MDDNSRQAIHQLVMALRAFSRALEKSFHQGMYEGNGDIAYKQYSRLHAKASQLLPDDFYVQDVLAAEPLTAVDDEQKTSQVMLLTDQLLLYLQGVLNVERHEDIHVNAQSLKDSAVNLQNQVLNLTQQTLKRVFEHIDISITTDDSEDSENLDREPDAPDASDDIEPQQPPSRSAHSRPDFKVMWHYQSVEPD